MNILLISPQFYPIFNKKSMGAIEKLERIYIKYNENTKDNIVVYSPKTSSDDYDRQAFRKTTFRIIDQTTLKYKVRKAFYAAKRRIVRGLNNETYIRTIADDIVKRNEQNKYDIIIFENGEQDIPIFRKKTKTNARIALHLHNDYVNKQRKNSLKIIESTDEIWTVSDYLAKQILKVKPTKVSVIPNAISDEHNNYSKKKVDALRRKYNSDDNVMFIFVGRIKRNKGIIELLESFTIYNRRNPHSKLLIAGSTERGKEGRKLKKILNKYSSENNNIHILGYISPKELLNYEIISDCQIVPSICEEAFGLVILEAMAANIKIIASRAGGIPEVGGNFIYYVNRENIIEELVNKMEKVGNESKLRDNYYIEHLRKYTPEVFAKKIYNEIHSSSLDKKLNYRNKAIGFSNGQTK